MSTCQIHTGPCLDHLHSLPDASIDCVVTSPPYWGLRDYGVEGQFGLEPTLAEYVANLVEVFSELRRVLKPSGTAWLNLGDSYAASKGTDATSYDGIHTKIGDSFAKGFDKARGSELKPKDLCGVPWRVAFALQDAGWWLRSDIIWHKPNPMPSSVTDRPTTSHEYVFLLTRSASYWYDAAAIAEKAMSSWAVTGETRPAHLAATGGAISGGTSDTPSVGDTRNARSVWTIATRPFAEAHFATMPIELAAKCILAGCPVGGTVYDPFTGAGTTALAALTHGRSFIGAELNPDYVAIAQRRIAPTLAQLSLL
jgi:DNA modification methylase